jgi:hypothetical protein
VIARIDNPAGGAAALKAGKVTGLSFGYRARAFNHDAQGRELRDIDLFEVSLVTTRCSMTRGSTWSPERGQPSRFSRFSSSRQFWGRLLSER